MIKLQPVQSMEEQTLNTSDQTETYESYTKEALAKLLIDAKNEI